MKVAASTVWEILRGASIPPSADVVLGTYNLSKERLRAVRNGPRLSTDPRSQFAALATRGGRENGQEDASLDAFLSRELTVAGLGATPDEYYSPHEECNLMTK